MSTMLGIAHTNRRIKHMFRLPLCVCRTGYDSLTQCTARRNWTKHMFGVVNFVDFVDSPPAHSGFINKILRVRLHSFRAWKRIGKNWFLLRFYYITFATGRRKHTLTHTCDKRETDTDTGYGLWCVKCMRLKWTIKFATSSVGRWLASSVELVTKTLQNFFLVDFVTYSHLLLTLRSPYVNVARRSSVLIKSIFYTVSSYKFIFKFIAIPNSCDFNMFYSKITSKFHSNLYSV